MAPVAVASALLLAVASLGQLPAPAASELRNLRWVRAVVSASSPEAVTLKLRDREITLLRDEVTDIVGSDPLAAAAVGATVEAHFLERKGVRRAMILISDPGPGELSRRPKTSLRGTMLRFKRSTLSVRSGDKTRGLTVEKKTRLLDRGGLVLATGKDAIAKLLVLDQDLLVKYETSSGTIVEGVDLGGSDNIVEIRLLR